MKLKRIPRAFYLLTVFLLTISMFPMASFAEEPEIDTNHHYLAFTSDLHADPEHLFDEARSSLSGAMKGFPEELDYVSILGDVIGSGEDAPDYKASDIYGATAEALMNEEWHLMEKDFSVICSDHDTNVEKDVAGVTFLKNDTSEEIYHGITNDGVTYCYIYGIGFDGMAKGGEVSMESAAMFKHWVRNKDTSIPILVLSHLPIQAMSGDNPGASYWNEALNFAATGVEGITGQDDSHSMIRNVFFLSGHNHMTDEKEYVFQAGTTMPVQADTTVEDSENTENTESSVYYTSLTPGYLCTSGNATLMDITEDRITLTKYHDGSEVSLGTDGATGETLGSAITLRQFKKSDDGGPVILKQPENAVVSYPEGASFTVEVEEPENVKSYQWYMLDKEDQVFFLEGSSARTKTLVVPSTQRKNDVLRFYCVVTNKDGLKTVTRQATLDLDNRYDNKPVFYVGEFAIEPGQSLDLSAIDIGDGYRLGSGRVEYDSNACDITIENLDFDNSHTLCGLIIAPNVGLDFEYDTPVEEEYNFIFAGENRIVNTYFNYDYNVGGIPFDFCITGEGQTPLVNFTGDGTLSVTNGTNAIRVIGDLMIGIDITVSQNRMEYADGIAARHILVSEGRNLDITVNGYAFNATGNLFMKDAGVRILSNTPHISQGTVTKSIVKASGAISLENTVLDIVSINDENLCGSTAGNNLILANGELFITKGSDVNCEIQVKGDTLFANSFTGISTLNGFIEDSSVSVKMDGKNCFDSRGIYSEEDFQFTNSELKVDMRSSGTVYGAVAERDFNAEDSILDVRSAFYQNQAEGECYGLVCENAVFKATDPRYTMTFTADEGNAMVCVLDSKPFEEPAGYEDNYESKNVYLRDNTVCLIPQKNAIALTSVPVKVDGKIKYAPLETIYDRNDLSEPAGQVVFGLPNDFPVPVEHHNEVCPRDNTCPMTPFSDTDKQEWYHDGVHWAIEKGIMNGTGKNTFEPLSSISRAMVVTMLWRMEGSPVVEDSLSFRDVPDGQWYTDAIRWASKNGIVNGYSENTFGPDDRITREQIATILYRYAQCKGVDISQDEKADLNKYTDEKDISEWAAKAFRWAVGAGIVQGESETKLSPKGEALRVQMATMLMRFENLI